MAIPYLSLDILCRFETKAQLPLFKGSALRGAFGHSLKKVSCALRNQECSGCLLRENCAYSLIFATEKLSGERISARPHPYIFNPPLDEKRDYDKGDSFQFNLVLLGCATEFLPHIVYTIEEMGRQGLGRGYESGAGRFSLQSISVNNECIYENMDKVLRRPLVFPQLSLEDDPDYQGELGIRFLSPLRLKYKNGYHMQITFSVLVRAALRRVSSLEKYYGGAEPQFDFRGLCRLADNIALTDVDMSWCDYKRYSNRQKREMYLGGLVGSFRVEGEVAPFVPIFQYVQKVNLGKQTAFGLGRMVLDGES